MLVACTFVAGGLKLPKYYNFGVVNYTNGMDSFQFEISELESDETAPRGPVGP